MIIFNKKLAIFMILAVAGCNAGTYRPINISSSNDAALRQEIANEVEKTVAFGLIGRFKIFTAEIYGPFEIEGGLQNPRPYYCVRGRMGFVDNPLMSKIEVALAVLEKGASGDQPLRLNLVHTRLTSSSINMTCNVESNYRPFPELIAARDRERARAPVQRDTPDNPN